MTTVFVPVMPSEIWSATLDFSMQLGLDDSAARGPVRLTSTHLHRCRCWIIHSGPFPSSAANQHSHRGQLLLEYWRTCWSNDVVRRGTIKTLIIDQLPNLLYLWQLIISVYFVDHVLQPAEGSAAQSSTQPQTDAGPSATTSFSMLGAVELSVRA